MLGAPLEESGTTSLLLRMRDRLGVGLIVALCVAGLAACGGGERQDANEVDADFPVAISSAEFPARQTLAQTTELTLSVENSGEETIPNLAVTIFTVANPVDNAQADALAADPNSERSDTVSGEDLADQVDQQLQAEQRQADQDQSQSQQDLATETDATTNEAGEPVKAAGPFSVLSDQPGLQIPSRPVWILEQGYPRLAGTTPGPGPPGEIAQASGAITAQTDTFAFGELEPGATIDLVWKVTPVHAGTFTVRYRVAAGLQGKAVAVTDQGGAPEGEFVVQISSAPPQTRVNGAGEVVPIKPDSVIGKSGVQQSGQGGSTSNSP